ncbi:hypothetical protein VTO42DRAFT_1930 [Malbranchea cinnamomea]
MPRTLGPTVLITAFTLVSVSTVIVAVRFYCRYFLVRAVRIYDYLMLLALCLTWGIATINYFQVKYGTGVHTEDQDPSLGTKGLEGTLKSWYTYQMVYLVDLCAVKFSILTFYRIISTQRAYRIAVYTVMGIVAAFTVAMVFVNAFECPNPSDAWSVEILFQGSSSCHDLHPIYYGQAAFNILSDVVILLLPMPVLHSLQMRRNKRIALIGIFSVGAIAVIASGVRVYALTLWSAPDADVPYEGANILIWSQIEINAAIISASIPSLKPLFSRTFGQSTVPYAGGTKGRYFQYYGRSYGGNTRLSRQTNFNHSYADPELDSSVSVSFGPLNGPAPATMELGGLRKGTTNGSAIVGGGGGGAGTGGHRHRNSDEEGILPNQKSFYIDTTRPGTESDETDNVNRGSGLQILRSVTIETSSRLRP